MSLIERGNIQASEFTYFDLTEVAEHNLADNRQELVFGFYNHTSERYVELDPRLGSL